MKILLIANNFPPVVGGSAAVYNNLCQHLGSNVVVVTPWRRYHDGQEVPGWKEADSKQPFQIERTELLHPLTGCAPVSTIQSVWRFVAQDLRLRQKVRKFVFEIVDSFKPDVVCLGELYSFAWLGALLRRQRDLSVVHYIHGEEVATGSGSRMYTRSALSALRCAEGVIAVSRFTRDLLLDRGVPAARIHTITNGVDLARFSPGPKPNTILSRHGLRDNQVILTVARLEERKGHDMVLRALPRILRSASNVKYLIAGEGSYVNTLKRLVEELELQNHVIFAGPVSDAELPDYYRTCDVFAMPNRRLQNGDTEGFGLVFLEAGACGKPVIGGKDGGVPDAITHGQNGFLVDGNSVEDVAAALFQLLSDRSLAAQMGATGLALARKASWAQKAAQFQSACLQAMQNGKQQTAA